MKRLLVTRSPEQAAPLAEALKPEGIEVVAVPVTRTEWLPADPMPNMEEVRWVVFTSPRTVEAMEHYRYRWDGKLAPNARAAALASKTADAVLDQLPFELVLAAGKNGHELAEALLKADPSPSPVLWPSAETVASGLGEVLEFADVAVQRWPLYRTVARPTEEIQKELGMIDSWDAVLFAAPSAVRAYAEAVENPWALPTVSIGVTTENALRKHVTAPISTATTPDTEGMKEAVLNALKDRRGLTPNNEQS